MSNYRLHVASAIALAAGVACGHGPAEESAVGTTGQAVWMCSSVAITDGETLECSSDAPGEPDGTTYECLAGESVCPPAGATPGTNQAPPTSDTGAGEEAKGKGNGNGKGNGKKADAPAAPSSPDAGASEGADDRYTCRTLKHKRHCRKAKATCRGGKRATEAGSCAGESGEANGASDGGAASAGCTLTQGYWKNHASAWPVTSLTIGGVVYSQAELLELFRTPPSGDASLVLEHQLAAALLNDARGAQTAGATSAIGDAQAWMSANKDADGKLPYGTSADAAGAAATEIATRLDTYNNGGLGLPHCD